MHDSHNFSRKIIIPRAIIEDPNVTQVIDIPANLAKAKNLVVSKTSTNKLVASALPDWKDELSGTEDDAPTNSLVATSISCSGYAPNSFQNATQPGGQAIQNVSLNATRNVSNARNLTSAAANATISRPGSANATFKAPDQSFRCPMTDYSNFEPVIASTFRSLTDLDSAQASPFDYSSSSGGFGTMDCSPSGSMDTAEFQKLMGGEYNRIVPMSQWSNEASSRQPDSFLGGGSYGGVGAYPCPQSPQNRSAPAALKTAARRQQDLFLGGGSYGGVGACPCPESPQNKSAPAALTTGSSKRQAANATVARQATPNATFARSANATFARPGSANATFARSGAANATFKAPDQSFKAPMTDYSNFEPVIASTFRSLTDLDSAQASPFDYSSSSGGFGTTDCSPSCSMDTAEFQKLMGGEYNRIVPMSQWSNEASSRQPDSFLGGGSYGGVGAYPCPQSPQNRSAPAALKTAARRQQDLFLGGGSYGGVGAYPCPESPQNKSAPAALTTGSSKRQAANATVARQATPNATFARSANATFARPGSANATFARSGAANATFKAPDQSFKAPMTDYSSFEPVIASTFRSLTDLDSAQASPFDYSSSSGGFGTIDCSPSCSMDTGEFQKLMGGEYNRIVPMSQWSNEASSRQPDSFLGGGSYGGVGAYPCPQSPQNKSAPAALRTDSRKRQARNDTVARQGAANATFGRSRSAAGANATFARSANATVARAGSANTTSARAGSANATFSRSGAANATFKAADQSFKGPMTDYSNFDPVIASTFRSLTDLDSAQASPFDYSSSSGGFGTMDCSPSCSMDTAEFQKLMGGEYNQIMPMSQWANEASSRQPDSFLGGGSYGGVGAYPCPQSPQNRSAPAALRVGSSKKEAVNATGARQATPNATFARSANATFARSRSANATFARSGAANATFKAPDQSFKGPMTDYSNFEPVIASTFRSLTDLDSAQASPFDYSSSSGGFGTIDCSPSCSMDTAEFQKLMGGEFNQIMAMSQWENEASSRQPDSFLGGGSYGGVGAYPCPQSPQNRSAPAALRAGSSKKEAVNATGARQATPNATFARSANATFARSRSANATFARSGAANATFKAPDQSFKGPMTDYSNFEPVIASTFRSLTDLDSAQASPFDYSSSSGGFGTIDCSPSCSMDTAEFQKLMGGEFNQIMPMSQWEKEASSRQTDSFLGGGSYGGVGAYPCPQSPQNRSAPAALKTPARPQQDLFLGGGSYGGVGAYPCSESPQNKSAPAALTTGSSKRQAANATVARQATPNATFARPGSANATFARSGAANATFKAPDQSFKCPMSDYSDFEPVIASTFRSLTDLDSAQASPFDYSSSSGGFGTIDCSPSCSMDTAEFQKLMGGEYNRIIPMSQWSNEASSRQQDSFLGGGSYGGVGAYPCPQSPQNRSAPAAFRTGSSKRQASPARSASGSARSRSSSPQRSGNVAEAAMSGTFTQAANATYPGGSCPPCDAGTFSDEARSPQVQSASRSQSPQETNATRSEGICPPCDPGGTFVQPRSTQEVNATRSGGICQPCDAGGTFTQSRSSPAPNATRSGGPCLPCGAGGTFGLPGDRSRSPQPGGVTFTESTIKTGQFTCSPTCTGLPGGSLRYKNFVPIQASSPADFSSIEDSSDLTNLCWCPKNESGLSGDRSRSPQPGGVTFTESTIKTGQFTCSPTCTGLPGGSLRYKNFVPIQASSPADFSSIEDSSDLSNLCWCPKNESPSDPSGAAGLATQGGNRSMPEVFNNNASGRSAPSASGLNDSPECGCDSDNEEGGGKLNVVSFESRPVEKSTVFN